jgi:hypothetical protein
VGFQFSVFSFQFNRAAIEFAKQSGEWSRKVGRSLPALAGLEAWIFLRSVSTMMMSRRQQRSTVDSRRKMVNRALKARARLFPDCKNQRRCAWTIAIAKPERQRFRRTCFVILAKIRLIVFSKNFDRPGIAAEETQRPPIRSEVPDWDTGIILQYGRCILQ